MVMKNHSIVMAHYSYPPVVGGVESVMQKHAELLTSNGFSVEILTGRGHSNHPEIKVKIFDLLDSANERILKINNSLNLGKIPQDFIIVKEEIKEWLKQQLIEADLLISHNICTLHKNLAFSAALYDLVQEKLTPPLIAWNHDFSWSNKQYLPQVYDEWPWDILKKTWSEKDHIHVTVSEDRKSQLANLLNISPDRIHAIPSGIEYDRILGLSAQTHEIIKNYFLLNAFPIILLPARITKRKNIELAVRIAEGLKKHYSSTALIITGPPGPHNPNNHAYFQELKDLRSQMELIPKDFEVENDSKVIFLTEFSDNFIPIETIYDLYRISDVLLFPSFQEGFGIPILEAGITGVPIFCSNIHPFHETAGELANYFELTDDPNSISSLIFEFLENDKSVQLKKKIRQKYTWEGVFSGRIEPLISNTLKISKDAGNG
jgi:glycosyltransferase involved in cell wall biosynthesis